MQNNIEKRSHFVLTVKDLQKSKEWYDRVLEPLGFVVAFVDERNVYYKSDKHPFFLAIFQGHEEFNNDGFNRYRVGFHHLGIAVDEQKLVDAMFDLLQEMGVAVEDEPRHYPDYGDDLYYALFFHDPDGLRLEVFYEEG